MGRGGETFWRVGIHCCGCVATVAFTAHNNACSASRIHACPSLPSPPVAGNGGGACLLVQVMGDWLSAARFPCRRFPFRFSSSAVSSLLFLLFSRAPTSNICPLMNNEQPQRRERLSKNSTNRKDRASAIRQTLVQLIYIVPQDSFRVWDEDGKGKLWTVGINVWS